MKKRFFFLLFFSTFFVSGPAFAATLGLSPTSGSFDVGDIFTVNILLNTQNADTDGVDIHYLNYPAALLEVQDADGGTAGVQISAGSLYANTLVNEVEVINGRINFSQTATTGSSYKGSGNLASISFKVLSEGTADVTFDFTPGDTTDTNVASGGEDILSLVTNGSYSISGVADTIPPTGTISINSGAGHTNSQSVILNLSASDPSGVSQMRFSNNNVNWSTAEAYSTIKSWTLSSGDGTKTVYVRYKDTAGNWNTTSFSDTIILDTTYPTISNIQASNITTNSAVISWTTDESATSQVEYGLTTSYGSQTTEDANLVTSRQVAMSGLSPNTRYHYRVISKDTANNQSISIDKTFTTLGLPDTTAPSPISNLAVSNITQTSVRLTWTSPGDDGNVGTANSYDIRYSTSLITETSWSSATQASGEPSPLAAGSSQSYTLVGLSNFTTYYFAIKTSDEVPNTSSLSNVPSVTTSSPPETTSPVVTITYPTSLSTYSTSENLLSLSGTASDNVGVTQVTWVNNQGGSGIASGTNNWSISLINLQSGSNVITVTARDAANNTGSDTLTVSYMPGILSVSLIAHDPSSPGEGSLDNVDLTAIVSGTASGDIDYTFYCNRPDSGTNITSGYDAQYLNISETSKTVANLCDYSFPATYFAKVIVERGVSKAEARVEITVVKEEVFSPSDTVPPAKVSNLSTTPADQQITLSWDNPTDADFVRVLIVRKESSAPGSRTDGEIVYEGDEEEYTDTNLDNDKVYYYAIYTYDNVPNYSEPIIVQAQPEEGKESLEKPSPGLIGDFNEDSKVNIYDLSILLSHWKGAKAEYDLSGNGTVDIFDLSILLSNWTK